MQAHPDRLVFIDKTSVKTNLTRQYGRSCAESASKWMPSLVRGERKRSLQA